jgi:hypothetical protein
MGKMFAVVINLQEPEITARCYGMECGRGIFSTLFDDSLGALVLCAHEACPHLDKQTDEPLWKDGEGRDVYLRRMTPLTGNAEVTGSPALSASPRGLPGSTPATNGETT